ncbi:hypothetical protein [Sorangium sp. So ce362]|uniref:hypothetical protein n=1 Tax=Sorangium sp. So ce362 TaxID=3133303 RepID=UPI003F64067E
MASVQADVSGRAAEAQVRNIDKATQRRLAVAADCDPRTVVKVFRGERVKGMSGERARKALIEAGLLAKG